MSDPGPTSPLDLLVPASIRMGYATRTWVRDSLPSSGDSVGDLDLVDVIYLRALHEAGGDHTLALFAATISVMEHRHIPLAIGIDVPLTLESQEEFDRRVARLPRVLFADRPEGDDRDKLQHFFASAWLTLVLDDPSLADLGGLAIERGEGILLQGGEEDNRDIRANRLGQHFATLLLHRPHALPSTLFKAWNKEFTHH